MELINCEGWWEQDICGRQFMKDLTIKIIDGRIQGSGHDIAGLFILSGRIGEGSKVMIDKNYLGSHRVAYVGTYDGEGTMSGEWYIGYDHGHWAISIRNGISQAESGISELLPLPNPAVDVRNLKR
jgi:hypothetical protein